MYLSLPLEKMLGLTPLVAMLSGCQTMLLFRALLHWVDERCNENQQFS